MNAEIGTEAAQFPGKEYINGIFVAACYRLVKNESFRFYSTVSVKICSKMCVDLPPSESPLILCLRRVIFIVN
jgi:hypothetical protein